MIEHKNKVVLGYKEPWMQKNRLNKFRTILPEVSSFVGNRVLFLVFHKTSLSKKDDIGLLHC